MNGQSGGGQWYPHRCSQPPHLHLCRSGGSCATSPDIKAYQLLLGASSLDVSQNLNSFSQTRKATSWGRAQPHKSDILPSSLLRAPVRITSASIIRPFPWLSCFSWSLNFCLLGLSGGSYVQGGVTRTVTARILTVITLYSISSCSLASNQPNHLPHLLVWDLNYRKVALHTLCAECKYIQHPERQARINQDIPAMGKRLSCWSSVPKPSHVSHPAEGSQPLNMAMLCTYQHIPTYSR